MAFTPDEIRQIQLKRGLFGYRKDAVHRVMDDVAGSFQPVAQERSQLLERVEALETKVARHIELERLLGSTLTSAERAARDLKDMARREAEVIVSDANAEARKVLHDAITEKEQVIGDAGRIRALLRSALELDAKPSPQEASEPVPAERAAHPATATAMPAPDQ